MKTNLTWGAAAIAMVWSGLAVAQVPRGTGGTPGSGGSTAAPVPVAPTAPPSASDAAATPAPPAVPPAEEAAVPVAPPAPEAAQPNPADANAAEDEAPVRRRSKKKRRYIEEEEQGEEAEAEDTELEPAPPASAWKLRGPHFVLSAERITGIVGWSQTNTRTRTTSEFDGFPTTTTVDVERSGTDVSLLGAGGFFDNPLSIPRVGLDYIFAGGFTLGGSLGYMATSGKIESPDSGGVVRSEDTPTVDIFLFAPRLGVFFSASPNLGIWLRGGITRLGLSSESEDFDDINGTTTKFTSTVTLVDLTLDPQLVFSPAPHVGITVGPTIDIGLSGTVENSGSGGTVENDMTASSYGVTAGLAALF
jgi:hypothetical protein